MKRLVACLCCILLPALGHAVPVRPLYEPPAQPGPQVGISLGNTTWSGRLYHDGEQVTFHPDGTLTYGAEPNGSRGSWRLTGNQLYFEINKWSEYQTIVSGDVISGAGWNKGGQKCQPFLRRISAAKMQEKKNW